jgi:hypothetical protein
MQPNREKVSSIMAQTRQAFSRVVATFSKTELKISGPGAGWWIPGAPGPTAIRGDPSGCTLRFRRVNAASEGEIGAITTDESQHLREFAIDSASRPSA